MIDHTLSAAGLTVPALGYGTWELAPDVAERGVAAALDVGYRHVDTASMYGNEEAVGAAIRNSGVDRDDIHLTTKVAPEDADDVVGAARASLDRLGLDHVDLLLIHWPSHDAPVEQVVEDLDRAREQGMTRAIGVSNYTSDQVALAAKVAPLATNQVEFHPFLSQDAVLEACRAHDMFLTAYSPLAKGEVLDDDTLAAIAEETGASPATVALRYLLDQGDVAALPRSSNPDHIASNAKVDEVQLTDEQRQRIADLPKDHRIIDPPFAPEWDAR